MNSLPESYAPLVVQLDATEESARTLSHVITRLIGEGGRGANRLGRYGRRTRQVIHLRSLQQNGSVETALRLPVMGAEERGITTMNAQRKRGWLRHQEQHQAHQERHPAHQGWQPAHSSRYRTRGSALVGMSTRASVRIWVFGVPFVFHACGTCTQCNTTNLQYPHQALTLHYRSLALNSLSWFRICFALISHLFCICFTSVLLVITI